MTLFINDLIIKRIPISKRQKLKFLVIVPVSLLSSWKNEIELTTEYLNIETLAGNKDEREDTLIRMEKPGSFDVCLASYDGMKAEKTMLSKFCWEYVICDECNDVKSTGEGVKRRAIDSIHSNFRLLINGTPIQVSIIIKSIAKISDHFGTFAFKITQ